MNSKIIKAIGFTLSAAGFVLSLLVDQNNHAMMKTEIEEEVKKQFTERNK